MTSEKERAPDKFNLRSVAETRDHLNRVTGLYTYDARGHLLKIKAQDYVSIPGTVRSYTQEFAYVDGKVSTMTLRFLSAPHESQFNYEVTYHYDAQGRLTGETTRILNSSATSSIPYENDQNGRIARCGAFNACYDEQGNIETVWWIDPNPGDLTGSREETGRSETIRENHFTYDTHRKPCFGIDELFLIEPLPYFGTATTAERNLSACNMVHGGGSTWLYTYDEAGFPTSIATRWNGVETMEPMIVKLKYIDIE